jgi:uncharacterized protein (UPF0548 family)
MFLALRPSAREIEAFLESSATLPLSYESIGLARTGGAGYRVDEERTIIGRGREAFERASASIRNWQHFDFGWVEVFPPRPPLRPETVVGVLVRHLGFWSLNGCRIAESRRRRCCGRSGPDATARTR